MDNNKLLDVTNYVLEHANNGILNIVENSKLLHKNNFKNILTEDNIKKVCYLYEVALKDMNEYLSSSYNYLVEQNKNTDFIEETSDKFKNEEDYCVGCYITLMQHGPDKQSEIIFEFYISFYYINDIFTENNSLKNPIIAFTLYLDNAKYDLTLLRKMHYPEEYEKMPKWFENNKIYAYDSIDYNSNLTSEEVSIKAAKFLENYLKDKLEDIKNARY